MPQKQKYYAVRNGRKIGIFTTWDECKKQTSGYSGAEYKSFSSLREAQDYMRCGNSGNASLSQHNDSAVAYVDGSYIHSKKEFSFGAVLLYKDSEKHFKASFSDPELTAMRNVAGEIKGAEFVMDFCAKNNIPVLDIYYDYEGIEKWCTGEWKTTKDGTAAYRRAFLEYSRRIEIRFHKVKGHSGDKYNDLADRLAKSALGIEDQTV